MPLMGSLYIGSSGLQTSQNALNTTAHNLSNVDTVGYTRQQVQQSDKRYVTLSKTASSISYQQVGLGTTFSRVKQVRDFFLDKTFRKESGRSMFYQVSADVMEEVEGQLGELTGEAFPEEHSGFVDFCAGACKGSFQLCYPGTSGTESGRIHGAFFCDL